MNHKKLGAFIFAVTMVGLAASLIIWQKKTNTYTPQKESSVDRYLELKGKELPPIKLNTIEGKYFDLADYKGKEVIVNFWASWCAPCVEEFPSFLKLLKAQKGKIIVLAISLDNNKQDIESFIEGFQLGDSGLDIYFSWDEDKSLSKLFGTKLLPESYLLDADHIVRRKIVGITDWSGYQPSSNK